MRQAAARVAPLLFLAVFYWPGLTTWFYQDDFGWLNVRRGIHGWADVVPALLAPKAHGNMRPLSETGFFTLFSWAFGVDAMPFRICVFATVMAGLWLLGSIVHRWTASWLAAAVAQVVWSANCGLAPVMCWTSIYNQALNGFFLLAAFFCLLRYLETGERRYWIGQWAAFLLGFGALEANVVYPALALAYAPKLWRRIAPMFAASALYAALHFALAPLPAGGVYALHADMSMLRTFWIYWKIALGPDRLGVFIPLPVWFILSATLLLTAAVAWFGWKHWFPLAWFVITLAPYLPLRDHVMDYYLAVPAIGLAMLGGLAVARANRVVLGAAVALYLGTSLPASRAIAEWHHDRSKAVEDMVLGVVEAHRIEPRKVILLAGVKTDVFQAGIMDLPFRVLEIPRVYLAPGSEKTIQAPPEVVRRYMLPEAIALREEAVVYDAGGPVLRNVTNRHAAFWKAAPLRLVNAGDALFAPYLAGNWRAAHDGTRVLAGTGSMRIAVPRGTERLWVGVFSLHPHLRVRVDGRALDPERTVHHFDRTDFAYAVPPTDRPEIEVTFETPGELTFGFAEIR